ncbi:Pex15p Ecym_2639 [Eremothecium cymbalariae DBVPG|uniref:Uncharacterized protein n=1 Tax=Eremothecium cymbalariae (strain CBS 270.75 / DBVPG 7215 / KCTC 17166 / NRRL Y-17582) TaxID=931890 RepID=G8JNS6_ERECY|nr:Hypothetical protein Ecym_2639 [Eremothecium cymbalariae DBVPG\
MSQVITKSTVTLDSLLQNEMFQNSLTKKVNSRQEKSRECRDLYLKANFDKLLSKMYQYKILDHGFDEHSSDLWSWFLAAISGVRRLDELTPEVYKHINGELSRIYGGIFEVFEELRILEREKLMVNYFRTAVRFKNIDPTQSNEYLQKVNSNMCREIGKLVLEVHSEPEVKMFAKLVEIYIFDLQISRLNKSPEQSLYWLICRKFPLLSSKLSSLAQSRGTSSTLEDAILMQLESKRKTSKQRNSITTEKQAAPALNDRSQKSISGSKPQLLQALQPLVPIPTEVQRNNSKQEPSKYFKVSLLRYLPTWMTEVTDTRFIALVVIVFVAIKKVRWFKTLSNYGLLSISDILNLLKSI